MTTTPAVTTPNGRDNGSGYTSTVDVVSGTTSDRPDQGLSESQGLLWSEGKIRDDEEGKIPHGLEGKIPHEKEPCSTTQDP